MDEKSSEKILIEENLKVGFKKKYAVIGAAIVILAILVVVGFLVGIYLFTDAFHNVVTNSMKTKETTEQDTNVDLSANIIEYRITENNLTHIFVDDYNTLISVAKLNSIDSVVCYLTAMNTSKNVELTKFKVDTEKKTTRDQQIFYVVGELPISDNSFLNRKARSLCKTVPTYWAHPICPTEAMLSTRRKRNLCGTVCNFICKLFTDEYTCNNYCWIPALICFFLG